MKFAVDVSNTIIGAGNTWYMWMTASRGEAGTGVCGASGATGDSEWKGAWNTNVIYKEHCDGTNGAGRYQAGKIPDWSVI